ncbi:MAG: hypothetical protein KF784_14075 [Fimbriimonadaceae bacterium]|nr:hypothetical protein [Fimbriimonadaceae bacterium]
MGIFDFWRRKQEPAKPQASPKNSDSASEFSSAAIPEKPVLNPGQPTPPPAPTGLPLDNVLGAILVAVTDAQKLANDYAGGLYSSADSATGFTQVPQAQIETVSVSLRFAIQDEPQMRLSATEGTGTSSAMVVIDADKLSKLPPQSITELDLSIRVYEGVADAESSVSI